MAIFQSIRAYFHKPRNWSGNRYILAQYNDFGKGVMDLAFQTPFGPPAREFTGQPTSWVLNQNQKMITQTPNVVAFALQNGAPQDITGGAPITGEYALSPLLNNFYQDTMAG